MQLRHKPAVLVLSRQALPTLDRGKYAPRPEWLAAPMCLQMRRAERLSRPHRFGQRISLAVLAHETLIAEGIRSRVVSMPSWDIFDHQTKEYRDSVLPPGVAARVAVEQASTFGWSATSARRDASSV